MQDEAIATTDSGDEASCMINVAKSEEEEWGWSKRGRRSITTK